MKTTTGLKIENLLLPNLPARIWGQKSILLGAGQILKIGAISRQRVESLYIPTEIIDVTDCFVTLGLIDPHENLLDGSGEKGFAV